MKKEFIAYIDESGDEGIQRGTERFILTAVIVDKQDDLKISRAINEIKERLRIPLRKPFHWKEIRKKHVSKKRFVIDRIAQEDFIYTNVVVNTYNLEKFELGGKLLYNYCCRYLIERITWLVGDNNGSVDLVFSNRSNISFTELKEYIDALRYKPSCQIRSEVVAKLEIFESSQKKMFQFADACASSLAEALNKDGFGYYDERFVLTLQDKLYRRKGNLLSYGLKLFPSKKINKYLHDYPWIQQIK